MCWIQDEELLDQTIQGRSWEGDAQGCDPCLTTRSWLLFVFQFLHSENDSQFACCNKIPWRVSKLQFWSRSEIIFIIFLFVLFMNVYVWSQVCTSTCVYMCMCMNTCARTCGSLKLTLGIFLHGSFTLSIEAESVKPRFADMASTTSQLALGILSLPSWAGITGLLQHPPDIYVDSGAPA